MDDTPGSGQDFPVIAHFEVRRRSYLAPDGEPVRALPSFASDQGLLLELYRGMVLTRTFDLKAVALQRTGRLGTYAVSLGQEAVSIGVASAMREEDVLLPSYRDNAALLWRGVKMEEILLYWGGDERGNCSSGPPPARAAAIASSAAARTASTSLPSTCSPANPAAIAFCAKVADAVCNLSGTLMVH